MNCKNHLALAGISPFLTHPLNDSPVFLSSSPILWWFLMVVQFLLLQIHWTAKYTIIVWPQYFRYCLCVTYGPTKAACLLLLSLMLLSTVRDRFDQKKKKKKKNARKTNIFNAIEKTKLRWELCWQLHTFQMIFPILIFICCCCCCCCWSRSKRKEWSQLNTNCGCWLAKFSLP